VIGLALAGVLVAGACGTRVPIPTGNAVTANAAASGAASGLDDSTATGADATGNAAVGGGGAAAGSSGAASGATSNGRTATAGNAGAGAAAAASGEPILLGAVGTRSGIVGSALAKSWRGLSVWERWVNANGGIAGRPVKVIAVDDAADPGKHASAVRRLILEDRVVAFVGDFAPLTFSAGVPFLEQYSVPSLGGDSAEAGWFSSPMAFPINGQTFSRAISIAHWGIANLPQRKVAIYYVNEAEAPRRLGEAFRDAWQERGGQVVSFTGVSLAAPDFTGEVINARNSRADVVFHVLEHAACNRFWDAARRQQYNPMWFSSACSVESMRNAKDLTTNHAYGSGAFRLPLGPSPAQQEIAKAVKRFDPSLEPDGAFMFAWTGGKLLEAALKGATGRIDGAKILAGLHGLKNETLGDMAPPESWGPGPHAEGRCGTVSKFNGPDFEPTHDGFVC
jgi:ABC-type branched-subunit amino acid transport system substrate-binding protein